MSGFVDLDDIDITADQLSLDVTDDDIDEGDTDTDDDMRRPLPEIAIKLGTAKGLPSPLKSLAMRKQSVHTFHDDLFKGEELQDREKHDQSHLNIMRRQRYDRDWMRKGGFEFGKRPESPRKRFFGNCYERGLVPPEMLMMAKNVNQV